MCSVVNLKAQIYEVCACVDKHVHIYIYIYTKLYIVGHRETGRDCSKQQNTGWLRLIATGSKQLHTKGGETTFIYLQTSCPHNIYMCAYIKINTHKCIMSSHVFITTLWQVPILRQTDVSM